tara:strand:+ start:55 stop:183 length:129 start_codon:yes stop_codon:yes gene_type:complete
MEKHEIIQAFAERLKGMSYKDAEEILKAVFAKIKRESVISPS